MSGQWAKKLAAATCVLLVVLLTSRMMPAGPQEPAKSLPSSTPKEKANAAIPTPFEDDQARLREVAAAIDKKLEAFDLEPHPLPPIPDDPPPHEGAMIDEPEYVIEPPDLVLVEVLEALPGRPVSGERLVRPDGTISLGFYGDVHVRGLTITQAKVKIIKHLRRFLNDRVLGLIEDSDDYPAPAPKLIPNPDLPKDGKPLEQPDDEKAKQQPSKPRTVPSARKAQRGESRKVVRVTRRQEERKADEPRKPIEIPLQGGGQVTIKIEVEPAKQQEAAVEPGGELTVIRPISRPEDTECIFVDVTAYNSKNYFVQGDVASPGRLPHTGHETVLDALTFAAGLIPTAEPRDIHLVRPARGGKPARVYKVDLEAIRDSGDATANYQIFPGDRLVVGRNDVVKKTVEVDRLAASMQTMINTMLQESFLLRSVQNASPQNHDAILRDLVEFWIQEMKRPEAKLDEQTLREALIKRLQLKPDKK